ncbi:MAG TPA: hypothetical protein DEA78_06360, partial [Cyanobacteria bacterium UBA11159]|nr:hypothetical protein [Cyanobacteria bacterium UBA11159]
MLQFLPSVFTEGLLNPNEYCYTMPPDLIGALTTGISLATAICLLWILYHGLCVFPKFHQSINFQILSKSAFGQWILAQGKVIKGDKSGNLLNLTGSNIDVSQGKDDAMEFVKTKTALEEKLQRLLIQEKIFKDIRSSFDPEKFFQTAVNQIGEAFKVDRCLVHIYLESPTPHIPLVAEYKRPEITEPWVIDVPVIGNPHVVRILSQDAAIVCHDVDKEPLLKDSLHLCHQVGLKSMVGVRTSYQGKPNGMIGIHQYHYPRQWLDEEI